MQSFKDVVGQIPTGKVESSAEENLAYNMLAVAEVFGHDAVFGCVFEGEVDLNGRKVPVRLQRSPITFAKLGNLIEYMEKKQKDEERQVKDARRKS